MPRATDSVSPKKIMNRPASDSEEPIMTRGPTQSDRTPPAALEIT